MATTIAKTMKTSAKAAKPARGGQRTAKAGEPKAGRAKPKVSPSSKRAAAAKPDVLADFTGFPKDFLVFFRELAKNNDREWFAANKSRYKASVEAPLLAFIRAMDLPLGRFADCFQAIAKGNGGSMFRIYRDTRFSRDKAPYKENAGCHFRHEAGKDAHAPGYYVHLEPGRVFYGGGLWRPEGIALRQVREAIAADPERWYEITRAAGFRRRFGEVRGDALKRPPAGFEAWHPAIEDLKRTSFFALQEVRSDVIHSKDFVRDVAKSFEALSPFMEFLTSAVGLPFHREI